MKKIKIFISLILFLIFWISNAGWPIPKGCDLEWYKKNDYCPSYYTIWKVKNDITKFPITEKELLKLDFPVLEIEEWDYYILWNNYFYDKWLKDIKESFFVWEWWINMWKINKWDVIIIDNFITWYTDDDSKIIDIETTKFIKNKIWFDWKLKLISSYWNYFKITCENDIISLSNEDKKYNLWFQNNDLIDKEVWKEKVRNNLQNYIKTCNNFNKLFNIEVKDNNYKNKKWYLNKVNKYKKNISKRFWKIISKFSLEKRHLIIKKIEKLRILKNNDVKLTFNKKEKINIIFDALIEILEN